MLVGALQQLMPTLGLGQLLSQSASVAHMTEHVLPLLMPLLLTLELLEELASGGFPPLPPAPPVPLFPSPPAPLGLLPNVVSSPSAHAAKLSPQSPIARRKMLACFTGLYIEATRMPACTQLPTLRGVDD